MCEYSYTKTNTTQVSQSHIEHRAVQWFSGYSSRFFPHQVEIIDSIKLTREQ